MKFQQIFHKYNFFQKYIIFLECYLFEDIRKLTVPWIRP